MPIVDLDRLKKHLRIDHSDDDDLLTHKIETAQTHVEKLLGYKIEDSFGGIDQAGIPSPLIECVMQLAGYWFEGSEALGVDDIVREYRNWSWA